ncbi:MAG: SMC family ATPase [Lachnospiraceae bacterium]|nr:SMC family ATPase [Lachnospiraceae bacterium]
MKPIYIKMSNFGSYRDEVIDFGNVNSGIFLITGDTGAGKTTIFDAITYALYDESSGGKKNERMMISQYAKTGERTEVEYCFSIGKDKYTITRTPEQMRYKKRMSDTGEEIYEPLKTPDKPTVSLILPDGSTFSGKKKETDEKIKEIIGIECQHFTQIAMLAQGEFLKLLHAESKERKKIFAKLFDTSIYSGIEEELESRYKALAQELEANKREIEIRLADVECMPESSYEETWKEQGYFSELGKDDIINLIDLMCDELSIDCTGLEEELEQLKQHESLIKSKLEEAEAVNKDLDDYEAAVAEGRELDKLSEQINNMSERLSLAAKAKNVDSAYMLYESRKEEYRKKVRVVNELSLKLKESKARLEILDTDKQEAERRYDEEYALKLKEQNLLEAELPLYDELMSIKKMHDEIVHKLESAKEKLTVLEKKAVKIEEMKNKLDAATVDYEEKTKRHNNLYREFINNYAMIMRGLLVEGEPCPVCGNTHHITVKKSDTVTVSQEDVKTAKSEMDSAGNQCSKLNKQLSDMIAEQTKLKSEADKDIEIWSAKEVTIKEQLDKAKEGISYPNKGDAKRRIAELSNYINNLAKKRKEAVETYQKAENECNILEGTFATEKQNCCSAEEVVEKSLDELEFQYRSNGFESLESYLNSKLDDDTLSKLKTDIENYNNRVRNNKHKIDILAVKTAGKERIDTTEYTAKQREIVQLVRNCQQKRDRLNILLNKNRDAKKNVIMQYERRADLEKKEVVLAGLYNTARGKISRKRINFQTYVQRRYFKRVIAAANERLIKLSGSQFVLRCRNIEDLGTQGEVGLDLDVYSIVNDRIRDVKTLSGGESFQAALAMALGLSDVIQNMAGKIHIDTMFIDEGFGSLSDDTRNQALLLLNELADGNRLIGVISHVSELKAQVETKLVVTKNEKGSHAIWKEG